MEMLKFDNRDIAHVPHLVKQIVELKVENIGLRKRLAEKEAYRHRRKARAPPETAPPGQLGPS